MEEGRLQLWLNSVELTWREQYVSRADMWAVGGELGGRLVHPGLGLSAARLRFTVKELWSGGEQVSVGLVGPDTRIVFRSSSANLMLFIQFSAEMWEMDTQGDLYWEKCINSLLPKVLFQSHSTLLAPLLGPIRFQIFRGWQESHCSHYVSIVVFSRWYYNEDKLTEEHMRKLHKVVLHTLSSIQMTIDDNRYQMQPEDSVSSLESNDARVLLISLVEVHDP